MKIPRKDSKDVIQTLKNIGAKVDKKAGKGSHTKIKFENKSTTVPKDNPVKAGTLKNGILRRLGIDVDTFIKNDP